jgi:hypothetical protein
VGALETPRESAVLWTDLSRSGLVGACLSATVEAISRLGTNRKYGVPRLQTTHEAASDRFTS